MIGSGSDVDVDSGRIILRPSLADLLACRQIPGAKWDSACKAWVFPATARTAAVIRARVRKLSESDSFKLLAAGSVPPAPDPAQGRAVPADGAGAVSALPLPAPLAPPPTAAVESQIDVDLPDGIRTKPWRHQLAAFKFCLDHFAAGLHGLLLALGMGCVEGDAELVINRGGCARRMSLREFYRIFNGGKSNGREWRTLPTRTRSVIDGELRLNEVLEVVSQGTKPVVRVTLKSGKSLRVTPDHEIACPGGRWAEAAKLAHGDVVLTNGIPACRECGSTHHNSEHGGYAHLDGGGGVCCVPKPDSVISVEPDGETDVYDIRMADPGHNFVANGIIVHNCGKTLVAIMVMLALKARRTMVVCPLRVVQVWVAQLERHCGIPILVAALDEDAGSVAKKQELALEKMRLAEVRGVPFVLVLNYDSAWRDPFAAWAEKIRWDLLVLDECVPGDTMIATPTGSVPIQMLVEGDVVLGVDDCGEVIESKVTATFRQASDRRLVQLDSLVATDNHPVWVRGRGYVPAAEVQVGDTVHSYENNHSHLRVVRGVFHEGEGQSSLQPVVFSEMENESTRIGCRHDGLVFNLETSTANYFAGGILVHNCHRIKAPGGKASLFFKRLRKMAIYRIALSGTPMPHGPMDIFGIFRAIDILIFGPSFSAFRQKYAVMGGYQRKQIVDFQRLDELERLMSRVTFRVGKEVLDLPPETDVTYHCELGAEARRVYDDLEEDFVALVRDGVVTAANAMVKILRLQQVCGGIAKTDEGVEHRIDDAKQKLLADTLEDIGPGEPVVVFCWFHLDLDAVHEAARAQNFPSMELSGRRDELRAWQEGKAQVLAVQIQAGGEGVDFTRARYSIFYSVGYSLGKYVQARSRTHRPGQTHPVEHIHLIARNTVDVKIMRALEKRAEVVESILAEIKN